jgi:hypothetical protein
MGLLLATFLLILSIPSAGGTSAFLSDNHDLICPQEFPEGTLKDLQETGQTDAAGRSALVLKGSGNIFIISQIAPPAPTKKKITYRLGQTLPASDQAIKFQMGGLHNVKDSVLCSYDQTPASKNALIIQITRSLSYQNQTTREDMKKASQGLRCEDMTQKDLQGFLSFSQKEKIGKDDYPVLVTPSGKKILLKILAPHTLENIAENLQLQAINKARQNKTDLVEKINRETIWAFLPPKVFKEIKKFIPADEQPLYSLAIASDLNIISTDAGSPSSQGLVCTYKATSKASNITKNFIVEFRDSKFFPLVQTSPNPETQR